MSPSSAKPPPSSSHRRRLEPESGGLPPHLRDAVRAIEGQVPSLEQFKRVCASIAATCNLQPDRVFAPHTLSTIDALVAQIYDGDDRHCKEALNWLRANHNIPLWRSYLDFGKVGRLFLRDLKDLVRTYGYQQAYGAVEAAARQSRNSRAAHRKWMPSDVKQAKELLAQEADVDEGQSEDVTVERDEVGVEGDVMDVEGEQGEAEVVDAEGDVVDNEEDEIVVHGALGDSREEHKDVKGTNTTNNEVLQRPGQDLSMTISTSGRQSDLSPIIEEAAYDVEYEADASADGRDDTGGSDDVNDGDGASADSLLDSYSMVSPEICRRVSPNSSQNDPYMHEGAMDIWSDEGSDDLDNKAQQTPSRRRGDKQSSVLSLDGLVEQAENNIVLSAQQVKEASPASFTFVTQRTRKRDNSLPLSHHFQVAEQLALEANALKTPYTLKTPAKRTATSTDIHSANSASKRRKLRPESPEKPLAMSAPMSAQPPSPPKHFDIDSALHTIGDNKWLNTAAIEYILRSLNPDPTRVYIADATGVVNIEDPIRNRRVKFRDLQHEHDTIALPVNIQDRHWTIAILMRGERRATVYDPLHNPKNLKLLETAIRELTRSATLSPSQTLAPWEIEAAPFSLVQRDDFSCGVLVLGFGLHSVAGLPVPTTVAVSVWRQAFEVVLRLIQAQEKQVDYEPGILRLPDSLPMPRSLLDDYTAIVGPKVHTTEQSIIRYRDCLTELHKVRRLADALAAPVREGLLELQQLQHKMSAVISRLHLAPLAGQNPTVPSITQALRPCFRALYTWLEKSTKHCEVELARVRGEQDRAMEERIGWMRGGIDILYALQQQQQQQQQRL